MELGRNIFTDAFLYPGIARMPPDISTTTMRKPCYKRLSIGLAGYPEAPGSILMSFPT